MDEATTPAPTVTLRSVQQLWLVFVAVIGAVAIAVPLLAPDPGSTVPAALPAVLALAAGLGALVGTLALDRGLAGTPPADDRAAARELRTRLVLQAAISEAPVLLAAALTFVFGPPWVAAVGAAPALLGLMLVRPSTSRLDRFDTAWRAAGVDTSLRRALITPTASGSDPGSPTTNRTDHP